MTGWAWLVAASHVWLPSATPLYDGRIRPAVRETMTPIRRAALARAATRAPITGSGTRARIRAAALALGVVLVAAGCTGGATASSTANGPTSTSGAAGSPSAVTQTATEWGRIWDALPPDFPVHPGAEPTEGAAGPASATLTVPAQVGAAAAWWQPALERAGYSTVAVSGPLEDGSIVIDSAGAGDCRIQVAITPTGSTTTVTILYGAACPFR